MMHAHGIVAPKVPSAPVNVTAHQVGITSVSVSWHVSEHPNGVIIGYMVWYAVAGDDKMVQYGCVLCIAYIVSLYSYFVGKHSPC